MQVANSDFCCLQKSHSGEACSTWIALTPWYISSSLVENCARNWSQQVLFCADLVIPNQSQGHRKLNKMLAVNGAYKQGGYEKNLVQKGVHITSINLVPCKMAHDEHNWLHRSICYSHWSRNEGLFCTIKQIQTYVTRTDQEMNILFVCQTNKLLAHFGFKEKHTHTHIHTHTTHTHTHTHTHMHTHTHNFEKKKRKRLYITHTSTHSHLHAHTFFFFFFFLHT